ncbi:MAG TPA: helix-turn-helix domain-containing protein [Acidimicrobiales bacterium]|nr:helix-turn-helix domain-containing protein [Acidimicrobiales bacterium]
MASDLRELGHADLKLRSGDHVCAFHFGVRQRDELLLPYLREGLTTGERCVCVMPPERAPKVLEDVANLADGTDAGGRAATGRSLLPVVRPPDPTTEPFLTGRATGFVAENRAAGANGHGRSLRVASDLAWVRDQQRDRQGLLDHERDLGRFVARSPHVAVCLCDLDQVDTATVMDLLTAHPKVLLGDQLVTGPLYLTEPRPPRERPGDSAGLEGVLALSMLMSMTHDVRRIVALVANVVSSLEGCRLDGVFIAGVGWQATDGPCRVPAVRSVVEARLVAVGSAGGPVPVPEEPWSWSFPLRGPSGAFGCLLVAADATPQAETQFLLRLLALQTGNALANSRLHRRQRAIAGELRRTRAALEETTSLLDWSATTHERLREVVATRGGPAGIAHALHEMTGHSVVVEDPEGRLQAWAGMDQPAPVADGQATRRQRMLERARHAQQPIWDGGRLVAVAHRDGNVVGTLALVDPVGEVTEGELRALADGAALLALELDHRRELAETESRLGRNLVDDLLAGTSEGSVSDRAQALGLDLERPHRVVLVEPRTERDLGAFTHAVRRAARDTGIGALLARHGPGVVVLSPGPDAWRSFHAAMVTEPGGGACRVGIGERCAELVDLPRSLRQATLALRLQHVLDDTDDVVEFEQLGIFRMLAEMAENSHVEHYAKDWLSPLEPLLDYDAANRADLVRTLSRYLEHGGRYEATAKALDVHRSTLKYRLQRIREIAGCDLTDPDTVFSLQLATRAWRTLVGLRRPEGQAG